MFSQECPTGKAKKYHEGESCCWNCFLCAEFQVRKIREDIHTANTDLNFQTDKSEIFHIVTAEDETLCILCPRGTLPNKDKTFCNPIFGLIFTILVLVVFMKNPSTPVVRASVRPSTLFFCHPSPCSSVFYTHLCSSEILDRTMLQQLRSLEDHLPITIK
jgi:hypothetical protein